MITTPTYLGTTQWHTNTHAAQMNPNKETWDNIVWMNVQRTQAEHWNFNWFLFILIKIHLFQIKRYHIHMLYEKLDIPYSATILVN
jgi:hypothetical protein